MIRNSERRATGSSTVESLPSASQADENEREEVGPSSDDESEGPRKRVKRDTG